jgi:hypothetical protein
VIVGFGGGSSIDTAKAVAILAVAGGAVADYKMPAAAPRGLPVVAIPTTAGAWAVGAPAPAEAAPLAVTRPRPMWQRAPRAFSTPLHAHYSKTHTQTLKYTPRWPAHAQNGLRMRARRQIEPSSPVPMERPPGIRHSSPSCIQAPAPR